MNLLSLLTEHINSAGNVADNAASSAAEIESHILTLTAVAQGLTLIYSNAKKPEDVKKASEQMHRLASINDRLTDFYKWHQRRSNETAAQTAKMAAT